MDDSMDSPIRALVVEDDEVDRMAFDRFFKKSSFGLDYVFAPSIAKGLELLSSGGDFDIIIADFQLGDGTAMDLFPCLGGLPLVVVTGTGNEETAVLAMKKGAHDYIIKDPQDYYLKILPETIKRALTANRTQKELEKHRRHLEDLVRERTDKLKREIDERKRVEKQLVISLKEKELLLREVHHRVKNNLAIISSLLSLQAESSANPFIKEAFANSRDRIKSMALVHEKLYQSKNLAEIEFAEYTRSLANYLSSLYISPGQNIRFDIRIKKMFLCLDLAIPCGMIINELISNSIKHAFPGGNGGEIRVKLSRYPGDRYCLMVWDNGVGLPGGFAVENQASFGLHLVDILNKQLGGKLEIRHHEGTKVKLTFPAEDTVP